MSNTSSGSNISFLGDFNANIILDSLGISREKTNLCAAVRFVYKNHLEDSSGFTNKLAQRQHAVSTTAQDIQRRWGIFESYSDLFFDSDPYDYEALAICVICDYQIKNAHLPIQQDDKIIGQINDGFDMDALHRASYIADEAVSIEGGGLRYIDPYDFDDESVFLGALNAYDYADQALENFNHLDNESISHFRQEDIPDIESIIPFSGPMGAQMRFLLNEFNNRAEIQARPRTDIPLLPAPQKPALKLVINNDLSPN